MAGIDVMNNVSSRTSLVIRNTGSPQTVKASAAASHGTPVVNEATWANLLARIEAGTPKTAATRSEARTERAAARAPVPIGRLAQHRVIVLGGSHDQAAAMRERIASLGGQTAANLTTSVTHAILLSEAERDSRLDRVLHAGLPELNADTLEPLDRPASQVPVESASSLAPLPQPVTLARGAVTDLPDDLGGWSLSVSWLDNPQHPIEIDVVAFVVDADEQIRDDSDFCFYNQPTHPTGAVDLELGTANEALVVLRPDALPKDQQRIIFGAAIDGERTFADVGPVELTLRTGDGAVILRSTLDAATTEKSMLLASLYDRAGVWRFRAVGQGYSKGLLHLAVLHGVDAED
jgi:DNA polymerase-3 subunit epsilon